MWTGAALGALVLLGTGWGHRVLLGRIELALGHVAELAQPLASLPMRLGGWQGRDVPIDERVLQVGHFDDDHVNRVYINTRRGTSVSVFVGYQGRPRARFGHRPDVCYPANGWKEVSQETVLVTMSRGLAFPSTLYEFRKPDDLGRPLLALATYMINGRYVEDPGPFGRYATRSVFGERPAYLTRVQVSLTASADRAGDLAALRELTALAAGSIANMMPYWEK